MERFLGGEFSDEKFDDGTVWRSLAPFESNELKYLLSIDWKGGFVTLNADPENADQACPAFELICRCTHMRILPSVYGGEALNCYFLEDETSEPRERDLRLALERLPDGRLYTWPATGKCDPPFREL
ncbi:MAG: hypothetical protein ACPGVU_01615 [Limisphaerales bacterium]